MFLEAPTLTTLLLLLAGYLLGSVSAAIIVCRLMRLPDPRTVGSNNPGATNVLRIGGKQAAAITLFGDMLKGLLAVALARVVGGSELDFAVAGLGAFLGHLYPLFFRFQGGKGVATFFGALLGIQWVTGLAALLCWLLFARVFRISSLAALITAIAAPALLYLSAASRDTVIIGGLMSVLLIWRHRSNIHKLLHGTEATLSARQDRQPPSRHQ